jgi:hypothetical protein
LEIERARGLRDPPVGEAITAPARGRPIPHGGSINHYVDADGLVIAPEVSLWQVRTAEEPPGGYAQGLKQLGRELDSSVDFLGQCLEEVEVDLAVRTPFKPAALDTLASARAEATRGREWAGAVGPGHYTGPLHAVHAFRLRATGMLQRALDAERAAGNLTPTIRAAMGKLEEQFDEWCGACEAQLEPQPHPLERLVHVQALTALIAVRHLDGSRPA